MQFQLSFDDPSGSKGFSSLPFFHLFGSRCLQLLTQSIRFCGPLLIAVHFLKGFKCFNMEVLTWESMKLPPNKNLWEHPAFRACFEACNWACHAQDSPESQWNSSSNCWEYPILNTMVNTSHMNHATGVVLKALVTFPQTGNPYAILFVRILQSLYHWVVFAIPYINSTQ